MKFDYHELITYMGMDKLPEGFTEAYGLYEPDESVKVLMPHDYYEMLLAPYELSTEKKNFLDEALEAIESDEKVLSFSKFFVWDMCSVRTKYDISIYTELVPKCLGKYNDAYAFLVLLACVPVAEREMIKRGIPKAYYEDIPHRMLRDQLDRYIKTGRIDVEDMPWKLNFYTLTIFLLDRFLFIPYLSGEPFNLYRSNKSGKVIGLYKEGYTIDSEGQIVCEENFFKHSKDCEKPGTGFEYVQRFAKNSKAFVTTFKETESEVIGYYANPCGFVEKRLITLDKSEWEIALKENDWLIALHIPAGEGYTPERMRNSMRLAIDFYEKYYPELPIKGFWSESWLYDKRLSFAIGKGKNITNCHEMMFCYTGGWNGEMAYIHLFKSMDARLSECECNTTLQKNARKFLLDGHRFCSTGMVFLTKELEDNSCYLTKEDEDRFYELMAENGMKGGTYD